MIFLKADTAKSLELSGIKFNKTIISLKHGFHLSLHVAVGNAEEEKYYETFYTLKLTLGPIGIAKNVNRADFKLSILYIDFYGLLRFVREIESILLKYVNVMSR